VTNQAAATSLAKRWPLHGWLGLALVAVFWTLNWSLDGLRSHWGFFPLWLGYCLTVDALVVRRKGTSMLTRSPAAYVALFVVSSPGWWLFELINLRTQNWSYRGQAYFTHIEYFLMCSVSFSTVMPAVFGTAELASTFGRIRRMRRGPVLRPTRGVLVGLFLAGWLMLGLLLAWPLYFFPVVWGSVYLLLDPVNVWLGNRSLLRHTATGDWRPVVALPVGCLICGLFWEMWNYYSYPKWVYEVPFVGFLHVFEMPALGYLGYIPFSWELFALYHLVVGCVGRKETTRFVEVCPDEPIPA